MDIKFNRLTICVDERGKATINGFPFVEAQISGENKDSHLGAKMICSSQAEKLRYDSHEIKGNVLSVTQRSDSLKVVTAFTFGGYDGFSVRTSYTNVGKENLTLEEASAFVTGGFGNVSDSEKITFYSFMQSHHRECRVVSASLAELGFTEPSPDGQNRIAFANVGSWSTKERLPQGIIDADGKWLMFQIESNNSWYYEISDKGGAFYLYLGGKNLAFNGWQKKLLPEQTYSTNKVAVCFGNCLDGVLGEMTKYRRSIAGRFEDTGFPPVIFNEYMHLSWDCPSEENTRKTATAVAGLGVKYYVIDCGWHNEEDGKIVYPYVGQWKESKARFPHGVRATMDYVRSLGMRGGLWIEPEVVGKDCAEMLAYYDDDCFIRRNGKKVCVMGRYFLDFRNKKVVDYMTESIRRMVEDYGADYIKMDYNEDLGAGTDEDSDSFGEGLEQCAAAYLTWIDEIRRRFPHVLFETCSSGGMRMDYETLSHFAIASTSDQTHYDKYPYIAGNILSAVLPEQAAVWSYPVGSDYVINGVFNPDEKWIADNVSDEQIVMNMINSFLGCMHLASHLEMLPPAQFALVEEGVKYFGSLSEVKLTALPCLPCGFTRFGESCVASGFVSEGKLYLAVWNLSEDCLNRTIPVGAAYSSVECAYPQSNDLSFSLSDGLLTVSFAQRNQARFFEIK